MEPRAVEAAEIGKTMTRPTVLLIEKIHPRYLKILEQRTLVVRPEGYSERQITSAAARSAVDAIVIRTNGLVSERVIKASPKLKIVARHGIGVDHIDIAAATRAGVWVVNTPGASRVAVNEHTWSMILALSKHLIGATAAVRRRDYSYRENKSLQLEGKTLGIIGLGRIGGSVALIGRAFGMNILYSDIVRYPKKERRLRARKVPLKTLLKKSDVVTVHTPLDESTRGLIGASELKLMQPHALLINCARGAIVDTYALAAALQAGQLGGAGLDVFDPEIPPASHPLLKSGKVVLTPHSAAQTPEANLGYAAVVDDVFRVLAGKRPRWPLNEVPPPLRG
jgi:phosphoglycerate dehydrogenase-like enzyme